jgi:hypothetical protein
MKTLKQIAALALLSVALPVAAGDKHVKGDAHHPKYGGIVKEMNEVQYELVAKPDSLAIFVEDHGKKVDTKGGSAKLTLLNGKDKTEATLAAAGENKLEAKGTFNVTASTRVVAVVSLPGKPAQSIRFALK